MNHCIRASLRLALLALSCSPAISNAQAVGARTASTGEIQQLREELEAIKAGYEARIRALEARLEAAAPVPASAVAPTPSTAAPAANATAPTPSVSALAAPSSGQRAANAFNPAIGLILSGGYTRTSQDAASDGITGFPFPSGSVPGPGPRGFSLAESELSFSASIDPWWRGAAFIALLADNSISVEEAFVQTTALGYGLSLKLGRFYSGIGYLNPQHPHSWDFIDNPLSYKALLGTQYGEDGVQLTWVAPTEQYIALGLELGRGRSFPGSDSDRRGAGMAALTAHTGGDLGDSSNWRAGISMLNAKADDHALSFMSGSGSMTDALFTGSTRVWVLDGVWKWAPGGNAARTSFKLQGEYLYSTRRGDLSVDPAGVAVPGSYRATQSGWYLQAIYQFAPQWRVGLRTEQLDPGSASSSWTDTGLASTYQPSRDSLMLEFRQSEFSRFRLQYARDRSREGFTDNQLFLQYQMSLGAHGAHRY
jgi:hypothetical protein